MAETQAPQGYHFTEKHEWAKIEGDTALIGISDYAQNALGDIVFIDLPKPGKKIAKGDSLGTIESVKAAEDLYSPLSGEVLEVNASLSSDPAQVNSQPFTAWMVKIKLTQPQESSSLLDNQKYKSYVSTLE